jgi:nitroreductase
MELSEGLIQRKSIRAFLDKDVPKNLLAEVLSLANNAPSGSNMQPWELFIVSGDKKKELVQLFLECQQKEQRVYKPAYGENVPHKYIKRTQQLFKGLKPYLDEAGVDNKYIWNGSLNFFNADTAVFVFIHKSLFPSRAICIGSFITYLTLAAHTKGLGTCIILYVRIFEDIIRKFFTVPDELVFMSSIALGYIDENNPINKFKSDREPLSIEI